MNPTPNSLPAADGPEAPAWGAVISMALGVFGLVTAEFLPASLLTPIAADLGITEGAAGQAVTVTAVVGMVASLLITSLAQYRSPPPDDDLLRPPRYLQPDGRRGSRPERTPDRTLAAWRGARWFLGHVHRNRHPAGPCGQRAPRAFDDLQRCSGATIVAAPVGSYVGELAGWRFVFVLTALLGVAALFAQFFTLPKLAPTGTSSIKTLGTVLKRPGIALGLVAATLVFGGHFAFFTYLRPYLEADIGAGIGMVSALLLASDWPISSAPSLPDR